MTVNTTLLEKPMPAIVTALIELAENENIQVLLPDIEQHSNKLKQALAGNDVNQIDFAVAHLYSHLHGIGSKYSSTERNLLDDRNAYSNYPGGLQPIVMAEPYIQKDSVTADLGSGNGLQALLLQRLYPHKKTFQVELSSDLIETGKILQEALGLNDRDIVWINDDILNFPLDELDFLYLFRPSRPFGDGVKTYHILRDKLKAHSKALTVFSIADCLADFVDDRFSTFYDDGHLTCFQKA